MLKFVLPVLSPLLILGALIFRFEKESRTDKVGTRLLLPLEDVSTGKDLLSCYADLRYRVLIPPNFVAERTGVVVVVKDRDGRASFSSVYRKDVPLRPREHLLKYTVAKTKENESEIRFAAARFRTGNKNIHPETIGYAVVNADEDGHTVLTGLADINGKILFKRGKSAAPRPE